MSLINCPECKKQVSDQAPACPNCGAPIASSLKPGQEQSIEITAKRFKMVSVCSVLAVIMGMSMLLSGISKDPPGSEMYFGVALTSAGVIVYIINRIQAWWHHG